MSSKSVPILSGKRLSEDAKEFAIWAHGKQLDKVGAPYEEHLSGVAANAAYLQTAKIVPWVAAIDQILAVAWLHDILEDTKVKEDELLARGYPVVVVNAVKALTKRKNEPQHEYLARIIWGGRIPMLVKLADLYNNTEVSRLNAYDQHGFIISRYTVVRLLEKYSRAIGALEALLEPTERRAWVVRRHLAALKAAGYTSYATSTSYGGGYGGGYTNYGGTGSAAASYWDKQEAVLGKPDASKATTAPRQLGVGFSSTEKTPPPLPQAPRTYQPSTDWQERQKEIEAARNNGTIT